VLGSYPFPTWYSGQTMSAAFPNKVEEMIRPVFFPWVY
jgi:hypothetical protein